MAIEWHSANILPEVGRKIVALYSDGSGAILIYRYDEGFLDAEGYDLYGNEFPDSIVLWAYLPTDFQFWCEVRADDPMTLTMPKEA